MKYDFKQYVNPVFIETGSAGGDGIMAALNSGFKHIISIELSKFYYKICEERFHEEFVALYPGVKVELHLGDSYEVLSKIISDVDKRCTFWLDAHYCGGESSGYKAGIPIMKELKVIKSHYIKNHTILIDDMRLLRNKPDVWGEIPFSVCDIEEFIYSINSDYKITYDEGITKDDILVAQI
jgi:hypothetical protein